MYVCLDTVIMYKHFITPVFSLLHLIFSSNGQHILRQRATEISPGHYPMDLASCFVLAMKNGTQRRDVCVNTSLYKCLVRCNMYNIIHIMFEHRTSTV